jgi:hypothetical protein
VVCRDDAAAALLLSVLADRVLAGEVGEVLTLEAPEWPRVPEALRRSDGRSVYRPHGGTRYAAQAQAQLTMEERLLAQAQQPGAPRLEPDVAARLLGSYPAQLEAQLRAGAQDAKIAKDQNGASQQPGQPARAIVEQNGSGLRLGQASTAIPVQAGSVLRLGQAVAAFHVVTSDRRAEILVGPGCAPRCPPEEILPA